MILGPILTIGGLIALFLVLGAKVVGISFGAVGILILLFLAWRISLFFGPHKICWRCGGDGFVGGLFGGKRDCSHCDGGLRRRIGAKRG